MQTSDSLYVKSYTLPKWVIALSLLLGACTVLVYLPVLNFGFINWDDNNYVYDNPHLPALDIRFVRWAFIGTSPLNMWHPLTWLSLWIDRHLWGPGPMGFHATNIVLHGLNTALVTSLAALLILTARSTVSPKENGGGFSDRGVMIAAAVTGILFGFHPIHVESVAWISERKDVLCAFFFLAGILTYLRYAGDRSGKIVSGHFFQGRSPRFYFLTLFLFTLSLLSKPMAVTFPLVLLILDWHPLGRFERGERHSAILVEKLPFLALSLADFVMAIAGPGTGETIATNVVPFMLRLSAGTQAPALYLWKMIVPLNLLAYYPYPREISLLSVNYLIPYVAEIGIAASCVLLYKSTRGRIWTAGWTYFIITLLPVLQFIPIGYESMADRYTYLPSLGPFLLAGLGLALVFERKEKTIAEPLSARLGALVVSGILVLSLSYLTVRQAAIWKNSLTFWNYVIEKRPGEVGVAYNNRGLFLAGLNRDAEALQDFDEAIAIDPTDVQHHMNRAWAYYKVGQYDKAIEDYSAIVKLKPRDLVGYINRGNIYALLGQFDKAIEDYSAIMKLKPRNIIGYINRGNIYASLGQLDKAVMDFTNAIAVDPDNPSAYFNRGSIYRRRKEYDKAISDLTKSVSLNSRFSDAYGRRGAVYFEMGQYDNAIADFNKVLSLTPNSPDGHFYRGNAYLKLGNTDQASLDFEAACKMGYRNACRSLGRSGHTE